MIEFYSGSKQIAKAYERAKIPEKLCEEIVDVCDGTLKITQSLLDHVSINP